jgi:hypothetical protein
MTGKRPTRDSYLDVGAAMRQALARALERHDRMNDLDWRVLAAVLSLTASHSKFEDGTHANIVATMAFASERRTRDSLDKLRDELKVISWKPKRGRFSFSTVGIPPVVKRTAKASGLPKAGSSRKPDRPCPLTEKYLKPSGTGAVESSTARVDADVDGELERSRARDVPKLDHVELECQECLSLTSSRLIEGHRVCSRCETPRAPV